MRIPVIHRSQSLSMLDIEMHTLIHGMRIFMELVLGNNIKSSR